MSIIVSIKRKQITNERLYNLAVKDDESYVANGIVVHNCKSFIVPNLVSNTGKNPDLTEGGLKPSKTDLEKYITLQEPTASFIVQQIVISKDFVKSIAEAQAIAVQYGVSGQNPEELESGYKFINKDSSLFTPGSINSLSPREGVTIFIGILKPVTLAEKRSGELQTIVVSKSVAKSVDEAKKIAKDVGAKTVDKVDETNDSYRFRQVDPGQFKTFRSHPIEGKGATLVYGIN